MKATVIFILCFGLAFGVSAQNTLVISAKSKPGTLNINAANNSGNTEPFITENKLPPKITLTKLSEIVSNANYELTACIDSDSELIKTEIWVNGQMQKSVGKRTFRDDCKNTVKETVILKYGDNSIVIKARNAVGETVSDKLTVTLTIASANYYALIIGVSEYTDPKINDLQGKPNKDAQTLAGILQKNYQFSEVKVLTDATRKDILRTWDEINTRMKPDDNLLVFYAGHGHFNKDANLGYWWPADAEKAYKDNWIYNDQIIAKVKEGNSKHFLLISDACFSGSIFGNRSGSNMESEQLYNRLNEHISRTAITSGLLETVPNYSKFFDALVQCLNENRQTYLSSRELFGRIMDKYKVNMETLPQEGALEGLGHAGGDFIFILKK